MPELPEVETVRKGLEKLVVGKTIQEVIVFWPRIIESPEVDVFQGQLAGQTIEGIERRGKFLICQTYPCNVYFYRWHAITLFRCTEIWAYDIGS